MENEQLKTNMKHAVLAPEGGSLPGRFAEAELAGRAIGLFEEKYTPEELELFRAEAAKWKVCRRGSRYFLADSDSGEDADGYYCGYFELAPEKAVFENGRHVGFYLCTDGMHYSGNDRASFYITDWGFPGSDIFGFIPWGAETHLFLFDDRASHEWS